MTVKKAAPKKSSPKKATTKTTPAEKPEEPTLKIVSTSKTQTISGKSTITYNLGIDDAGHFFIRIFGNTGGGFYSNEWVSMDYIKELLAGIPKDRPITSLYLSPLFKKKSVNTPGFLLVALVSEKLLSPLEGKKRHFAYTGADTPKPKATKRKTSK